MALFWRKAIATASARPRGWAKMLVGSAGLVCARAEKGARAAKNSAARQDIRFISDSHYSINFCKPSNYLSHLGGAAAPPYLAWVGRCCCNAQNFKYLWLVLQLRSSGTPPPKRIGPRPASSSPQPPCQQRRQGQTRKVIRYCNLFQA